MTDPKPKTNRLLLILTLLFCCAIGLLIPYGHSRSVIKTESTDESISNETSDKQDSSTVSEQAEAKNEEEIPSTNDNDVSTDETVPAATTTPTPTPEPTPTPIIVSPEAAEGTWVSNHDGTWCFMVNGAPYIGWLTDTDGHRYYFAENGIMQTGLIEVDNERYYLDEDGIMQTGNIKYKDQLYFFNDDGTLYGPATNTPKKQKVSKNEVTIENKVVDEAAVEPDSTPDADSAPAEANSTPEEPQSAETNDTPAIALTFSDSPSDFTADILSALSNNSATATFFVVGSQISGHEDAIGAISSSENEIGNQSYSNIDLTIFDAESVTGEYNACAEMIENAGGSKPNVARAPEGIVSDTIIASTPYPEILWSVDGNDLAEATAETIAQSILEKAVDGDIILLKDDGQITIDALNILLPELNKNGIDVVSVSELAKRKGVTLQSGTSYTNIKNPGV